MKNINFEIFKGEKIALIGNNGSGKTTLFKIINKTLLPDTGNIKLGTNVNLGYYDQDHSSLNDNNNLFEEVSNSNPDFDNTTIRNVLAAFLFSGDDVFKKIGSLSGGEKGRLLFAKLMLSNSNFLLLDEPTNHLDIVSKNILESALQKYEGTLLFISHDRYFINQVATRILHINDTSITSYLGNYDYFIEKSKRIEQNKSNTGINISDDILSNSKEEWLKSKELLAQKRKKESELKKFEDDISSTEKQIQEIDTLLTQEEIYTDYDKANSLSVKRNTLESTLENLYNEWEKLMSQ